MGLTYDPGVFRVGSIEQAKQIILTAEGAGTDERWARETGYLAGLMLERVKLGAESVVLDYGCGIGRMAKELIARTGCSVVGVDISAHMRMLGVEYVESDRFMTCSPEALDALIEKGLRVDAALSVWVLQHCLAPADDIARIRRALKPGGDFFLVNNHGRAVPTVESGWVDDGVDLKELLAETFDLREEGRLAQEHTSAVIAQHTFWAVFTPLR